MLFVSTYIQIYFYALISELIPMQPSSFSKCDICIKFVRERVKSGGRGGFKDEYSKHLQIVEYVKMNTELTFNSCYNYTGRKGKKYYGHREKAMSNPNKCNTIIIDGFDQYKTNAREGNNFANNTID